MRKTSVDRCVVVGLVATFLWSMPALGQRPQVRPNLEEGERIYKQNCVTCHGSSGKGDGAAAGQLDPKPADLTSTKTQEKRDADLMQVMRLGRAGTAMPGWASELDERDLQNVLAYIRSLAL